MQMYFFDWTLVFWENVENRKPFNSGKRMSNEALKFSHERDESSAETALQISLRWNSQFSAKVWQDDWHFLPCKSPQTSYLQNV